MTFPKCLSGLKLDQPEPKSGLVTVSTALPNFYSDNPNPISLPLPILPEPRRALIFDAFDLHHRAICKRDHWKKKKPNPLRSEDPSSPTVSSTEAPELEEEEVEPCICRFCEEHAEPFHRLSCNALKDLSPCQALIKLAKC